MKQDVEDKLRGLDLAPALSVFECIEMGGSSLNTTVDLFGVSYVYGGRCYLADPVFGHPLAETLRLGRALVVKQPGLAHYLSGRGFGQYGTDVASCLPARAVGKIRLLDGDSEKLMLYDVESYIVLTSSAYTPFAIDISLVSKPDPQEIAAIENDSWMSAAKKQELIALRHEQYQRW